MNNILETQITHLVDMIVKKEINTAEARVLLIDMVSKAEREGAWGSIGKMKSAFSVKYPLNRFPEYTNDPNVMTLSRGVQEPTYVRRLNSNELEFITFFENVLSTIKENYGGNLE